MNERNDTLVQRAAALPDEIQPQRDLWPDIAARLTRHTVAAPAARRWWPQALVAGVALAALSSSITWWIAGRPTASPAEVAAAITAQATPYVTDAELLQVRQKLTATLDDSLQRLAPKTRHLVSMNLLEIQESMAEIRAALEQDPENAFLHQLLHTIYRQELDLLTDINKLATSLPAEIQT